MAFQIPKKTPFSIETRGLGVILFQPFLAGTLKAFEKALNSGEAGPVEFLRNFTADQARWPCNGEAELSLQYANGSPVDVNRITSEDLAIIASEYLRRTQVQLTWYASGDGIEMTDSGQWSPAKTVRRAPNESDIAYLQRLAQECVNESARSYNKIAKSFKSLLDLDKISSFAQADLKAVLSANRIRTIANTPITPARQSISIQASSPLKLDQADAAADERLSDLIGEVQRVGALIAEQCEIQRSQNQKTDLLIEASNEATGQADQNLKWAKYGIYLTSILSMASLILSIYTSHQQGVADAARDQRFSGLSTIASSSREKLAEISKRIQDISNDIKAWHGN